MSVHVAPASSDRNSPPSFASTSAYILLESAPETDMLILPGMPAGIPGLRVSSFQVSPPSVDWNSPLPAPPLESEYGVRKASHSEAYNTFELCGSITRSMAPDLLS